MGRSHASAYQPRNSGVTTGKHDALAGIKPVSKPAPSLVHLTKEQMRSRPARQAAFFGTTNPVVFHRHGDGYSPFFWGWMMGRSTTHRAHWAYHHRHAMDADRYDTLMEDHEVRRQVTEMEEQGVPRDAAFVPEDLPQSDLMYTDEAVRMAAEADGGDFTLNRPAENIPIHSGSVDVASLLAFVFGCFALLWIILAIFR